MNEAAHAIQEWMSWLGVAAWPPAPEWLFWVALALVAGALLGVAASRWLGLPRLCGYGAAGILAAGLGDGLAIQPLHIGARLVIDLALGLLLFELGSRVSLRWLRHNPALLWTSALEFLASMLAMGLVLSLLGFEPGVALLGACLLASASGAVVGRVATELKSSGQVTERMLVLSALNTFFAVLVLKLLSGWLHLDRGGDWARGLSEPLFTLAGSLLLAALLCRAVAWVMRRFELSDENTVLLLLGLILLALTGARALGLSTLLLPLLAGVMLRNTSERPCIWPRHFGTAGGVLVLMMFVVLGATWSASALALGAAAALALLLARGLAKALVLVLMARSSGIDERQGLALALSLSPVSATALVLLAELQREHAALAQQLSPVVLSAIAAMAIAGPVCVQWGLRLAAETQPPESPSTRSQP